MNIEEKDILAIFKNTLKDFIAESGELSPEEKAERLKLIDDVSEEFDKKTKEENAGQ